MRKTEQTKRQKTSLAINPVLWRQLRVQTLQEGRPAYQILDQLVRAYLQQQKGRRA